MQIKAHAKINLALDVVGERPDGYHLLRTVMQMTGICDSVVIGKAERGISCRTNLPELPCDEKNLAVRAAQVLLAEAGRNEGLSIELEKKIPTAAGLAGGSSDAAAVLIGVNELLGLGKTKEELCRIGERIGADVPFCVLGGAALAEGIGERLRPLPAMPPCHILLAKLPFSVSTPEVFAAWDPKGATHPDVDAMVAALRARDLGAVSAALGNALADVTERMHPEIARLRHEMIGEGAVNALMSGSGPTVFGIFDTEEAARHCRDLLLARRPEASVFLTEPVQTDA